MEGTVNVAEGSGNRIMGVGTVAVGRLGSMVTVGKVSFILSVRTMAIAIPNDNHSPMRKAIYL